MKIINNAASDRYTGTGMVVSGNNFRSTRESGVQIKTAIEENVAQYGIIFTQQLNAGVIS